MQKDRQKKEHDAQHANAASRLEELDALRGLCTCAVIVSHMSFAFGDTLGYSLGGSLGRIANVANFTFFAMSGHVVAYHYLQNGKWETLVGAAFRRIPRLMLPMIWANLLSWQLAVHGGFGYEQEWRRIKRARGFKSEWCKDCMTSELGDVLETSVQVLWSVRLDHFLWLWTIHCEIIGSFLVFILAPISRWIANFNLRLDGTDDLILIKGQVWPQQLLRCVSFHSMILIVLVAAQLITHCADFDGPLFPDPWCDSYVNIFLAQIGVGTAGGAFFLFDIGLASAHVRTILANASKSEGSWAQCLLSTWKRRWWMSGLVPACLIVGGLSVTAMPGDDLVLPWHVIHHARSIIYEICAVSIMLGVLCCPEWVKEAMKNLTYLGQLSFSMYLLHMSIIWSIGMRVYVWSSSIMPPDQAFVLILCVCAPCIYWLSALFHQAIEEPLGVKFPRYALEAIKWLLFDVKQSREQQRPTVRMGDVLSQAAELEATRAAGGD